MSSPYSYPAERADRAPRVSILTLLAALFVVFGVWEISTSIGDAQDRLLADQIAEGDEIRYHYTARLPDGTVFRTSRLDVAEQANGTGSFVLQPTASYRAQTAVINASDPGLGWGAAADAAVIGKRVGQTVRFQVDPANGTGEWQSGPTISRTLTQGFDRVVFWQEPDAATAEGNTGQPGFNLTELDAAIGPLVEGNEFVPERSFPPAWPVLFEDINWENRSILFRHLVEDGEELQTPALPGPVTASVDDAAHTITFRLDLQVGDLFAVEPQSDLHRYNIQPGSYRVQAINDTSIQLEYHASLRPDAVGHPIDVELEIIERVQDEEES